MNYFEKICMMTGYIPITKYWETFTNTDQNEENLKSIYKKIFQEAKKDYKCMTELVMVLNHKLWEHYDNNNKTLAKVYQFLYDDADEWCFDHLKDDELTYFINVTD